MVLRYVVSEMEEPSAEEVGKQHSSSVASPPPPPIAGKGPDDASEEARTAMMTRRWRGPRQWLTQFSAGVQPYVEA